MPKEAAPPILPPRSSTAPSSTPRAPDLDACEILHTAIAMSSKRRLEQALGEVKLLTDQTLHKGAAIEEAIDLWIEAKKPLLAELPKAAPPAKAGRPLLPARAPIPPSFASSLKPGPLARIKSSLPKIKKRRLERLLQNILRLTDQIVTKRQVLEEGIDLWLTAKTQELSQLRRRGGTELEEAAAS